MNKKESLWQLLKRLDEEAGQFNFHLHKANHYFDKTSRSTKKALQEHEDNLHRLIRKVKKSLKLFLQQNKKK